MTPNTEFSFLNKNSDTTKETTEDNSKLSNEPTENNCFNNDNDPYIKKYIFDPNKAYKPGSYIVGIEVPSGLVRITCKKAISDPIFVSILQIDTGTRITYKFETLSFWLNLVNRTVIELKCPDDTYFLFEQEEDVSPVYNTEQNSRIYKIGTEVELPCKITNIKSANDNSVISVYCSNDGTSYSEPVISSSGEFWLEGINANYLYIKTEDRSHSYSIASYKSVRSYSPLNKYYRGFYKAGKEIPTGWIKVTFLNKNFEYFDYYITENPMIRKKIIRSHNASVWLFLKDNDYLYIDNTTKKTEFSINSENSVSQIDTNPTFISCVLKAGSEIPAGWFCISVIKKSSNDDRLKVSFSTDPYSFTKENFFVENTIWLNIKDGEFVQISSNENKIHFKVLFFEYKVIDPNSSYNHGIRRVGCDIPEGFVKIGLFKNESGYKYSISKDPLKFEKYYDVPVKSTWLYLERGQFIDILPNDLDSEIYFETSDVAESIENKEVFQRVFMIGCDFSSGIITISSKNKSHFYYAISDEIDSFPVNNFVTKSKCVVDATKGKFLRIVSADKKATFKIALEEKND